MHRIFRRLLPFGRMFLTIVMIKYLFNIANIVGITILAYSAIGCHKSSHSDNSRASDSAYSYTDEYHADNDIAMTLRSITDALSVGEPLDTIDYNFEGVLTDGAGHPLYTDIQGTPGAWEVDVISPTSAVIRNIYLGDLLPDDLESYIAANLNLSAENIVESSDFEDDDETQLVVYDLGGCTLRIETRAAVAPNGLEGPLMRITALSNKN